MTYIEQEQEALRLIKKFGPYWMLKDEEAIGEIIGTAINARLLYNPDIGKFSTYLIKSVKNKIYQLSAKRKFNTLPIDDTIQSNKKHTIDIMDFISSCHLLTNNEKFAIRKYYFGNETMEDIGNTLNISRQRVKQYIDSAIAKLKEIKHVLVEK